jgi:LysM repeat protein
MESHQQSSNARLAAILGLSVAFIVLIVIVASSLGGGGGSENPSTQRTGGTRAASKQKQSQRRIYVVKPGDCCLSQIADKTGVDLEALEQANPHLDPQAIHSGDRVKLR